MFIYLMPNLNSKTNKLNLLFMIKTWILILVKWYILILYVHGTIY